MVLKRLLHRSLARMLTQTDSRALRGSTSASSKPFKVIIDHEATSFCLDEMSRFEIGGTPNGLKFQRWQHITYCNDKRYSLVLIAGEHLRLNNELRISRDTRLYIRYAAALPSISDDGLSCEISFIEDGKNEGTCIIAVLPIIGGEQSPEWRAVEFDLGWLAGSVGNISISCYPGWHNDPTADWLAIADLSAARQDQLNLTKARSFHESRSRTETEHFSSVYRDTMYSNMQENLAANAAGILRPVRKLEHRRQAPAPAGYNRITELDPEPGESPYMYAIRLLAACIPQSPPNFVERLKRRSGTGSVVKVLSLCSGAARIEASYAAELDTNVEWSLLDINADLLKLASLQFAPSVKLDLIEANANELEYFGEKWDIILCVSGLHHVVELEKLLKFCHDSLAEGGEFWSIGEYIGRNGNRLWPDAQVAANAFFSKLPEKFRINQHTGNVDVSVPDNDCSVGCFEGIRSEDIEFNLYRWFVPIEEYRRNCFLWRLVNHAYSDNYDLRQKEDREWIAKAVSTELDYFRAGGRGTELFGVYRARRF